MTYRIVRVLYKGVPAGLAAQGAGLVKEVVETREFPEFGEDLDEGVSRSGITHRSVFGGRPLRSKRTNGTYSSTVEWRFPT